MPTLDVVVPCYNYARYLQRCVSSVLGQDGVDVRVLIIDDCSSDNSALVGQKIATEDPRVEFRRHSANQGHIATFNEGLLGWANADYSLLLSADDALAPGAFERALRIFEASGDVGLVYGMCRIITHDDEFRFPPENDFSSARILPGTDFIKHCCEFGENPVPTPTAFVRTTSQHRLGGYRSDHPHTGDLEMWMRFALAGSVGVIRSVQGDYRRHSSNMSLAYYNQVLNDRREFARTCEHALEPIRYTHPDALSWLAAMHACLFAQAQTHAVVAFDDGDFARSDAWSAFALELSRFLENPRRSRRLMIQELVGYRIWRLLSLVQYRLPGAAIHKARERWNPVHGDIIGWWPMSAQLKVA